MIADDPLSQAAILPTWMLDRARADARAVEIAEDDADTVALFMALDTQWRLHPMTGARIGLDYAAVEPTAKLFGLSLDAQRMGDLRAMEIAALNAWAERSVRQ